VVPPITSKRDLGAIWAQRRAIAAARPDVVQINLPVAFSLPYTVLAALTIRSTSVVVVEHLPMATRSRGIRTLKRLTDPRLAAHLAVGASAAREIERLNCLPTGSVRAIPNGVPLPVTRHRTEPPNLDFVVGAVGRFNRQKGLDVLIRAVARVSGASLVLVGDGPERAALQRLAAECGIADRVVMTGWTDSATAYLPTFDVLAIPSRYEGLPLVLLEGMLTGCAIVATGVGSMPDVLQDGETGALVPVDDVDALRSALVRLRDDLGLRQKLGSAASEFAHRRYTVTTMARRYEEVYEEIMASD